MSGPCLSALRIHPLGVDCVRKMASGSILHVVCVCINRIGTEWTSAVEAYRIKAAGTGRDEHIKEPMAGQVVQIGPS